MTSMPFISYAASGPVGLSFSIERGIASISFLNASAFLRETFCDTVGQDNCLVGPQYVVDVPGPIHGGFY